jgi:hypothetical protein
MDLPIKRLWVTEHRVEEKQCPACFHLTRAFFPPGVSAPAQYGTGIQTLATYLVEGQAVPLRPGQSTVAGTAGSPALGGEHRSLCQNLSPAVGRGGNSAQSGFGEGESAQPG